MATTPTASQAASAAEEEDKKKVVDEKVGKKWHVNAMGNIVYKNHESYAIMRQIQMGIRTCVMGLEGKGKKKDLLTPADFNEIAKYNFPKNGSMEAPAHNYDDFVFYAYAPLAFRNLRGRFGIEMTPFLTSLCHDHSLAILGTPGKSGSLFMFSLDMQYILKTITKAESKYMRKILPNYYNHVMANGSTMINRFYGMFSIKPTKGSNVRFIIMNNVFDTEFFVNERYDLKGSTDGRTASEKERKRDAPIYKDLDFLEKKRKMRVGPEMKKKIIDQLKADTAFLEKMKIMDYSMLLGMRKLTPDDLARLKQEGYDLTKFPLVKNSPMVSQQESLLMAATATPDSNNNAQQPSEPSSSSSAANHEQNHDQQQQQNKDAAVSQQPKPNDEPSSTPAPTVQVQPPSANNNQQQQQQQNKAAAANEAAKRVSVDNRERSSSSFMRQQFLRFAIGRQSADLSHMNIARAYKGTRVSDFQQFHGGVLSADHTEIYFFGIIDLLQEWNTRKQFENFFKGITHDSAKISAVPPKDYAKRFLQFLEAAME